MGETSERTRHDVPWVTRYMDEQYLEACRKYGSNSDLVIIGKTVPEVVIPIFRDLKTTLQDVAAKYRDVETYERIDGRHAGIITFGDIFDMHAERLSERIEELEKTSLDFKDVPEGVRNDRLIDLTCKVMGPSAVVASIADDVRQRYRSEIEEARHADPKQQAGGSSTMPHKMNPFQFENIKGLYKTLVPWGTSVYLFAVMEHEGDSTNDMLIPGTVRFLNYVTYMARQMNARLKETVVFQGRE